MRLVARAQAARLDPELELRTAARRFAVQVRDWERTKELPLERAVEGYDFRNTSVAM
jgi:hypothetical protein